MFVNCRNDHCWNNTNSFFVRDVNHQHNYFLPHFMESFYGILWNKFFNWPYFYQVTVTGNRYYYIILNEAVKEIIENTAQLKDYNCCRCAII